VNNRDPFFQNGDDTHKISECGCCYELFSSSANFSKRFFGI